VLHEPFPLGLYSEEAAAGTNPLCRTFFDPEQAELSPVGVTNASQASVTSDSSLHVL